MLMIKMYLDGAIVNEPSWRIMEKLGFKRLSKTRMVQYSFVDELVGDCEYVLTKLRI